MTGMCPIGGMAFITDLLLLQGLTGTCYRIIKEIPSDDLFGNKVWVQDFTWISPSSMVLCPMVNDDVQAPINVVHLDSADHVTEKLQTLQ